ncbi:MAG: hypothetical protein KDI15_01170, partial [Thiothrix sp.]|nr:hypothetical protein [Thiothrix sp.]
EAVNPETGEVISNRYGEFISRVKGLALNDIPAIETRIKVWTIQPKAEVRNDKLVMPEIRADYSLMNEVLASVRDVFFQAEGRSSPPWSPVNNCTEPAADDADDYARAERAAIVWESIRSQSQEVAA